MLPGSRRDEDLTGVLGSVSSHLARVKAGDPSSLEALWQRYYPELLERAQSWLRGRGVRHADEEDVVTAAFASFYRAASQGHYPDLRERQGLWRLLLTITGNKALDLIRSERCAVRGGGRVVSEAALEAGSECESDQGLQRLLSREPTPFFAALFSENFQERLRSLPDAGLQRTAVLKLEGYENREIAAELHVTERTVERKLALIRKLWSTKPGSRHVRP